MSFLVAMLIGTALVAVSPAVAGPSSDYQQVVDLTFPFTEGTPVRYSDDYHAPRGGGRVHQATDLMVAFGTPVHAAVGGRVSYLSGNGDQPASWGWHIAIAGDDGREYHYLHLGSQTGPRSQAYAPGIVREARVTRGQLIGWAGCSGNASCGGGEHLHFEIHDPNVVDPYHYHDEERINPYRSLKAAEARGDYAARIVFIDVPRGSTHEATILRLVDAGITSGCGIRRFCPKDPVTRQQMATFLARALRLPPRDESFRDVAADNRHAPDIGALAAEGITAGCGARRFCPTATVTREQMATFLARALGLSPRDESFTDVAADNPHARDIGALAAAGITKGCNPPANDRFCPEAPVTREQMASFLVRAFVN